MSYHSPSAVKEIQGDRYLHYCKLYGDDAYSGFLPWLKGVLKLAYDQVRFDIVDTTSDGRYYIGNQAKFTEFVLEQTQ